ncbi:hypothetical protein PBI_MULCIBER_42 [Mycobacterium phage Mulciber]|uniref:hypothetical protein n=1 Tax=Mycobacterium phage Mulciber TaxID=1805459 RepID=UPI00078E483E|nr:hypothetical protein BJD74_gp66 [Mycobacterium phage Mulciber]AQT28195.1 hypothetical protein SEA_JABITH_43 [Mycobacterium phage Jabith]AXC33403.1 hypothetical protein SEA_EBONY_43 [Mycobacterium phage Ebony]AXH50722.1 hypothetical protein SEA_SNAPE_42 [Mycobacterium phage Snape]QBI97874.1 hypothetical protein SEA_ORANGE_42 [Mycobacterium phage Orange]QBI98216.1 hypothetical protein SEA_BOWTIE_43 [Mycobacterium phage Bowtie]QBI99070.1 hypothetical protein SEA_SALZ_42 [Mycobacterium phage S
MTGEDLAVEMVERRISVITNEVGWHAADRDEAARRAAEKDQLVRKLYAEKKALQRALAVLKGDN